MLVYAAIANPILVINNTGCLNIEKCINSAYKTKMIYLIHVSIQPYLTDIHSNLGEPKHDMKHTDCTNRKIQIIN